MMVGNEGVMRMSDDSCAKHRAALKAEFTQMRHGVTP